VPVSQAAAGDARQLEGGDAARHRTGPAAAVTVTVTMTVAGNESESVSTRRHDRDSGFISLQFENCADKRRTRMQHPLLSAPRRRSFKFDKAVRVMIVANW
jgi:hypothetical protein